MNIYFYQTAIGKIGIAETNGSITNIFFECDTIHPEAELLETSVIREAHAQLETYLSGSLQKFELPLKLGGTAFMEEVWKQLRNIPYGKTASYRDIAEILGNPGGARAVGMANNRNPIPIIIPCHRVIGTDGRLVGYRGGVELKSRLLELEKGNGSF